MGKEKKSTMSIGIKKWENQVTTIYNPENLYTIS